MTYEPKKGDRVRITDTREGVVHEAGDRVIWITEEGGHRTGFEVDVSGCSVISRTIEKLPDPEPQWVNGDVVKIGNWLPGHWYNGSWRGQDGQRHPFDEDGGSAARFSNYWQRGEVEILYKADQQDAGEKEVA